MISHNGIPFRSSLEARWGVFFYALGIEHEYQSEEPGVYRPDFYLPRHRYWVEVSAEYPGARRLELLEQFAADRETQSQQQHSSGQELSEHFYLFWGEMETQICTRNVSPRTGHERVGVKQHNVIRAKQISLRRFQAEEEYDLALAQEDPDFRLLLKVEAEEDPENVYDPAKYQAEYEWLEWLQSQACGDSPQNARGELLSVVVHPACGFEGTAGGDWEDNIGKLSKEPFAWAECPLCESIELRPISHAVPDHGLKSFVAKHRKDINRNCNFPVIVFETGRILDAYDKACEFVP